MENEQWRDVFGYEGLYKVSSLGRVYSVRRAIVLKGSYESNGYIQYHFYINLKVKTFRGHHLVVWAFIDSNFKAGGDFVCDHINRKRDDNRAVNLRIVSHRQNATNTYRENMIGTYLLKGKYRSQIHYNGKRYSLGDFCNEIDAHNKYIEARNAIINGVFIHADIRKKWDRPKSSKYKGVSYMKQVNKWQAMAQFGTRRKYIGVFKTEEEAHCAIIKTEQS